MKIKKFLITLFLSGVVCGNTHAVWGDDWKKNLIQKLVTLFSGDGQSDGQSSQPHYTHPSVNCLEYNYKIKQMLPTAITQAIEGGNFKPVITAQTLVLGVDDKYKGSSGFPLSELKERALELGLSWTGPMIEALDGMKTTDDPNSPIQWTGPIYFESDSHKKWDYSLCSVNVKPESGLINENSARIPIVALYNDFEIVPADYGKEDLSGKILVSPSGSSLFVRGVSKKGKDGDRGIFVNQWVQIPVGWHDEGKEAKMCSEYTAGVFAQMIALVDGYAKHNGGVGVSVDTIVESAITYAPQVIATSKDGTAFGVSDGKKIIDGKEFVFSRKELLKMAERYELLPEGWQDNVLLKHSQSKEWSDKDEGGYFEGSFLFFKADAHKDYKHPSAVEGITYLAGGIHDHIIDEMTRLGYRTQPLGDVGFVSLVPSKGAEKKVHLEFPKCVKDSLSSIKDDIISKLSGSRSILLDRVFEALCSELKLNSQSSLVTYIDGEDVSLCRLPDAEKIMKSIEDQWIQMSEEEAESILWEVDSLLYRKLGRCVSEKEALSQLPSEDQELINVIMQMGVRRPVNFDKMLELALKKQRSEIPVTKTEEDSGKSEVTKIVKAPENQEGDQGK